MGITSIPASVRTADFILTLGMQSVVFLLCGWIISSLLRRASAPWRSGVLLSLIFILALWPLKILLFPVPQTGIYQIAVGIPILGSADLLRQGGEDVADPAARVPPAPVSRNSSLEAGKEMRENRLSSWGSIPPAVLWTNVFGGFWMLGTLLLVVRIFYGLAYLSGFRSGLREIDDPRLSAILEEVRAATPGLKQLPVYSSPAVRSPLAFGLTRPRIVIPESLLTNMRPDEFRSLLVHEMSHLRHYDQAVGILQRFVAALYWWNPLVRVLNARFSAAREEVCDNYGILESGARPYAECLVELAQKTELVNRLPSAVGIATPHISLEERIGAIVSKKRNLETRLAKSAIVSLAVCATAGAILLGSRGLSLTAVETLNGPSAPLTVVPLPMVKQPIALTAGNGKVYVLDVGETGAADQSRDVKIFSASNFSFLKSLGQPGSGSAEFLLGPGIPRIHGDSVWVDDIHKIVVFSPDGEFQRTIPFPKGFMLAGFPLLPVSDHYVTINSDFNRQPADGSFEWIGRVYDKDLNILRSFTSGIPSSILYPPPPPPPPAPRQPGQKEPLEKEGPRVKTAYQAIPDCIDFTVAENKIFFADTRRGFHISVFDDSGIPLYEIKKDYAQLEVPADFQNTFMKLIKDKSAWLLDVASFKFREEYPAFMSFKVADGKIYVATYARQKGMNELIVMNLKGDILKRSFSFPLSSDFDPDYHNFNVSKIRYDISQGKIFFLTANERTGVYELHVQALE